MRVIHIIPKFTQRIWGGAESLIVDLIKNYPTDIKGEIWTCRTPGDQKYETLEGIKVSRFTTLYPFGKDKIGVGKPGLSLGLFLKLLKLHQFNEPVLLHLHCHNSLSTAAVIAAKARGIKSILTLHSQVAYLKPRLRYYLTNEFSISRADRIVAVSEVIAHQATAVIGREDIAVIPNGIDFTWLQVGNRESGRLLCGFSSTDNVKLLLFVGRIVKIKNLEILLHAFAILVHSMGVTDSRLILVGPEGEPGYINSLRKTASKLNIGDRVVFLGPVAHKSKALADLYAAANVIVMPSMFESQPVVVLEAWAAERPVVVADVGGMGPMVRQFDAGFIWNPNTGATGLAKVLYHALTSHHSGEVRRNIQIARNYFDIRKTVQKYITIYESLIRK